MDIVGKFNRWQIRLLTISVWSSALLFGLYIVGYYALALMTGEAQRWNDVLPGLYQENKMLATTGIGVHFLAGGIILILGCLQLLHSVRQKWPALHRLMGRIYILACIFTSIGGLVFILLNGTIGGWLMDMAFGLYGMLMLICAIQTFRFAYKREAVTHRAWAIRLFSLAIGSWFYRMGYGFWFLLMGSVGHTATFDGAFDQFMNFFFFLPNLLVAQMVIGGWKPQNAVLKLSTSLGLVAVILYVWLATYFFTVNQWADGIVLLWQFSLF